MSKTAELNIKPTKISLENRRASYFEINASAVEGFDCCGVSNGSMDTIDLVYRTLCGILYNFVPQSGHPGGSISSGRFVNYLLYNNLDFDFSNPDDPSADVVSYAAGHKALGLYAAWALRDEIMRITHPGLLPEVKYRLRLEDLLGFRRNATEDTPLFLKFGAKPLDGHPSPLCPFVKLSTGASGVGVASSVGLAFGMMDSYGKDKAPRLHIVEGEGGLTAGRAHEAIAGASSAGLSNIILHLDWNQASIDSEHVCREGATPGDYVQWTPAELFHLHDWNVVYVEDGFDWRQIAAAQKLALSMSNSQPTAVVYRTVKGWRYGIEGRASHGSGHGYCSDEFYTGVIMPFSKAFGIEMPATTCKKQTATTIEATYYEMLLGIRHALEDSRNVVQELGERIAKSRENLVARARIPRTGAPDLAVVYDSARFNVDNPPPALQFKPGDEPTLRGVLGDALGELNRASGGALIACSADLLESTSVSKATKGFAKGLFNAHANPEARTLAVGGICEDAIGGVVTGISACGRHIGVSASYAAFIAALQHIPARLHAIGQQARHELDGKPFNPIIMINGHAGVRTGEDGPTHADVQALQLLQGNFPQGSCITLTPWEAGEIWPLLITALHKRPAIIAPFVTRPKDTVVDRVALGIPSYAAAAKGLWPVMKGDAVRADYRGCIVLQGSDVMGEFVRGVLPELKKRGVNMNIYYISSLELFELLPAEERNAIFPQERAREAMGITGFTLTTMQRWIQSEKGRELSVHPFRFGRFLSSGKAEKVMQEAGIDAAAQLAAVEKYMAEFEKGF